MSLFFIDLWTALSAIGDGLMCNPYTPAQSKHTFSFSAFIWNLASKRLHFGSVWEAFFVPNCNFEWKRGFKKWFTKMVSPLIQTRDYDHSPGLPDSPPRVRGFLNKKQLSEQETRTAAHFWVNFWVIVLEWVISESMSGKLWFFYGIWNKKR